MNPNLIIPVLLCGGTGTRLWPLSRESFPKQFLPIVGNTTLVQQTADRVSDPSLFGCGLAVCNNEHRFMVAEQLRPLGDKWGTIIVEPMGKNTAAAAAVAAIHAQEQDPHALMLLLPADHVIGNSAAFVSAVRNAAGVARGGRTVLFGIEPTSPASGYGYILKGESIGNAMFEVDAFVEKPEEAVARKFLSAKTYLWNSGIFLVSARHLLSELEHFASEVVLWARAALVAGERDLDFLRLGREEFSNCPSISLDHAVLEHTRYASVVELDCGWTDLGSWSALWELGSKDSDNNVHCGEAVSEFSRNCYLRGEGPLVAAVGVEDLIVVASEDVVLVTHRSRDQDVKQLVEKLKADGRKAAVSSRRIHRPWGYYESIQEGHRYQVKRITVNPGGKLSLQKHFHRAEHWVVVNGTAMVTCDDEIKLLRENESVYLPLGAVHRLENPGKLPLNLIEVQSGAYLGEDDIVRLEDVYLRG